MTPENIIEQWADCFNNADMKGILSLYHDNATLLPTFLPKPVSYTHLTLPTICSV